MICLGNSIFGRVIAKLKNRVTTFVALLVIAMVTVSGAFIIFSITKSSSTTFLSMTSTIASSNTATNTTNSSFTAKNSTNTSTETAVGNYTMKTTLPSEVVNSTSTDSAVVQNSETPCIPTSSYILTTTVSQQNTTATGQLVYDGTNCDFGNGISEAPSAILIPANTLTWTNFRLQENGSYYVSAGIDFLAFPDVVGANITVAVYLNGNLSSTTISQVSPLLANAVANSSLMPPSNSSSNSIFALKGMTPLVGVGGQTGSVVNLNGTTITIAFLSDKPLWVSGWTPEDMSKGAGLQFGQSLGQLNGTYEWTDAEFSSPSSLPQPTTTLTFELEIPGSYSAPCKC